MERTGLAQAQQRPLTGVPLIDRAVGWGTRTALVADGRSHTYESLLEASAALASTLLAGRSDLQEARVAFLCPPGFDYVATQWAIWRAGGVAVPLAISHPPPEWEYVLSDADAEAFVVHPDLAARASPVARALGRRLIQLSGKQGSPEAPALQVDPSRRAIMLYTSGTTGKPKGVVTTHQAIGAQVESLVEAWAWREDDRILHVLPLHHVHGILNVLCCALWSGACCEFVAAFDPERVWNRFTEGGLSLFMAVPTIYTRLIRAWEEAGPAEKERRSAACASFRLMVCGSAALPVPLLEHWRQVSGHTLLERYGMTEIGMALSNPLEGERLPGCVGRPLPKVQVRVMEETGAEAADGVPGEIQVRGPTVFSEYWRRPDETARSFTADGWFRTGDTGVRERGIYRILGRTSVDIIKTGGYKVSALEIEQVLLEHPQIDECAVVGMQDPEWGERVSAAVKLRGELALDELRSWCKERLAVYKIPSRLLRVAQLPRNAMGKVIKPEVARLFSAAKDG